MLPDVWALVRRPEHARAIAEDGIRVSGKPGQEFTAHPRATSDPARLPPCDLGIVGTKATQTAEAMGPVAGRFRDGAVVSAQNGLGCEEIIAQVTGSRGIRATTFMSGTRHSDTHVTPDLDAPTRLGPFAPTGAPPAPDCRHNRANCPLPWPSARAYGDFLRVMTM